MYPVHFFVCVHAGKCPFMKRILKYFSRRVRAQTNFEEIVKAVTELLQAHHRKQPQQTQESMKVCGVNYLQSFFFNRLTLHDSL